MIVVVVVGGGGGGDRVVVVVVIGVSVEVICERKGEEERLTRNGM